MLKKANLPGPDYYEFSKVEEVLRASISDGKARIAAAFASLMASGGLTKEKLLESAGRYIEIITKDREGFQNALAAKQQEEVGSRKTRIEELAKEIDAGSKEIQALTKKISENQTEMQTLNNEIAESDIRIKKNGASYLAACDEFTQKITNDVEHIKTNL